MARCLRALMMEASTRASDFRLSRAGREGGGDDSRAIKSCPMVPAKASGKQLPGELRVNEVGIALGPRSARGTA